MNKKQITIIILSILIILATSLVLIKINSPIYKYSNKTLAILEEYQESYIDNEYMEKQIRHLSDEFTYKYEEEHGNDSKYVELYGILINIEIELHDKVINEDTTKIKTTNYKKQLKNLKKFY